MPMYILDTDTVSLFRTRHPKVVARFLQTPHADLFVSTITVEEQIKGWYDQLHRSVKIADIEKAYFRLGQTVAFYSSVQLAHYTGLAIQRFLALNKLKLNIDPPDLRISAIALDSNATVVTRNVRDFQRVPGLIVEDWSQ